jgi:hypothetical protein
MNRVCTQDGCRNAIYRVFGNDIMMWRMWRRDESRLYRRMDVEMLFIASLEMMIIIIMWRMWRCDESRLYRRMDVEMRFIASLEMKII